MEAMEGKKEEKKLKDVEYASYHGCDQLEKEIRCDYYFYGKTSELAKAKDELLEQKPRCCPSIIEQTCFLMGAQYALGGIDDVIMVMHAPQSCCYNQELLAGLFLEPKIYCTQVDEEDALLGGNQKLKEALVEVFERFKPGCVAVVGSCVPSITGDDLVGICEWAEKEKGVPVLALGGAGFYHRNWNFFGTEIYNILIDRMKPSQEKNEGSINIINGISFWPHWKEVYDILPYIREMGIKVNVHFPRMRTFQELIERFPRAELNITRCPADGLMTCEYAEKKLGIPYLRLPRPISMKYTETYLRELARFFHVENKAEEIIEREKKRIAPRLEKLRKRLKGKRIAFQSGPATATALLNLFCELGMEVVFVAPWGMDSTFHELLQDWLDTYGQDPEAMSIPSYELIEPIIHRLKPDIYIGMPDERTSYMPLGVRPLDFFAPADPCIMGFEGVVLYGEYLAAGVESNFYKKYSRYLVPSFPSYVSQEFLHNSAFAKGHCQKEKI